MGEEAWERTLAEVIARRAQEAPTGVAVRSTDRAWTNADLLAVSGRVAARVDSGQVAIAAVRRSSLAVASVGAASVRPTAPLALDLPDARRAALLERLRPVAVLDGEALLDDTAGPRGDIADPDPDAPAFLLTTSGTTAEPKLVPNTHRNLRASARFAAEAQRLGPGDRCLALGSMAHVLGLRSLTDALWCGASVLVPDELTVEDISLHLREHAPTCVVAAPPLLHSLLAAVESLPPADRDRLEGTVRYVRSGAAALREGLAERLAAVLPGTAVVHGYGMSEVAKIACTPLDGSAPAGSVGRPLGVELRLDEHGEIHVRGEVVAPGYADDRHQSASGFENGWFRTGDLGRLDDDGYLFLLGRRDDVVSRGGVLVSLDSLEAALEAHPDVRTAVAVAVDHPNLGTDVVVAFRREGDPVDPAALREFLAETLGVSQAPTRIVELDDVPLTSSGKPSRAEVAELVDATRTEAGAKTDDVEIRLATLWRELLLLDGEVGSDDDFFALGASSLHLVELCDLVATTFGAELTPGELIDQPSLRGMAQLVREGATRVDRPDLVRLRGGDRDHCPLYVVPGAGGTLAALPHFVAALEPGRPVFGFETPGLYREEGELPPVADLAERFAVELRARVDGGPFGLLGFCFGAVIAQEMSRRLEAEGTTPDLLVMFDIRRPGSATPVGRIGRLGSRLRKARLVLGGRYHPGRHAPETSRSVRDVTRRHVVQPSSAPTLLFASTDYARRVRDPHLGWSPYLLGDVEVVTFDGTHQELLREKEPETAAAVDHALRRFDRGVT